MLLLLWLLGTVASFAFCSYMKGHSDARFDKNKGITENPPWVIGIATSWIWPLQVFIGALWGVYHVATGLGDKTGLAVNEELHGLRQFAREYQTEFNKSMAFLTSNKIELDSVDDKVKRELTAASIEWGMEDASAALREEKGLEPVLRPWQAQDEMYQILEKNGVPIPESNSYRDFTKRTGGELQL